MVHDLTKNSPPKNPIIYATTDLSSLFRVGVYSGATTIPLADQYLGFMLGELLGRRLSIQV
jgi:hypothetical protein